MVLTAEFTATTTPTLQIGRIGLDIVLTHPISLGQTSNRAPNVRTETLSITGQIKGLTVAEANAMRTELLAQTGRMLPVTYSYDPQIDGYYYLDDISLDVTREYSPYTLGMFPFSAQLTKVFGIAFEVALSGGLVANAHSITATVNKGFVGVADTDSLKWLAEPSGAVSAVDLESRLGTTRAYYALDPADYGMRFAVDPADYYKGGCEVWVDSRLRSNDNATYPDPTTVSLINGLAGVAITADTITVGHYATSWRAKEYQLVCLSDGPSVLGAWEWVRILRNDPEMAVVQLAKARNPGLLILTVSIHRGWRMISFRLSAESADAFGIERTGSEAASALGSDVGIVATAPDANDHKFIVVSPDAHDTTNLATNAGIALTTPATSISFALGMVVNSTSPDNGAGTQDLIDQFFNYIEPRQILIFGAV